MGAIVPVATYTFAHYSELLTVRDGRTHYAEWTEPNWLILLGGLFFSARTVCHWAHQSFEDWPKSVGFVLIIEGVLMRSPIPELSYVALGYLVILNALGTGAVLALRDQRDRAARAAALTAEPEIADEPPLEVSQVRSLTAEVSPLALTADTETPDDAELYRRAVEHVRTGGRCSGRALRAALGIGSTKAGELAKRLASELTGEGSLASEAAE